MKILAFTLGMIFAIPSLVFSASIPKGQAITRGTVTSDSAVITGSGTLYGVQGYATGASAVIKVVDGDVTDSTTASKVILELKEPTSGESLIWQGNPVYFGDGLYVDLTNAEVIFHTSE